MKFELCSGLNPVAAFRAHGPRYAVFTATKTVLVFSNLLLSGVTLVAAYAGQDFALYKSCEAGAFIILKIAFVAVPFLLFEAIYWRYRFHGIGKAGR